MKPKAMATPHHVVGAWKAGVHAHEGSAAARTPAAPHCLHPRPLQSIPGAPGPAHVSHATGRADSLFSRLPFDARCLLRIDDVAAYSVMDDVSACPMAALVAVVTAAAAGLPPPGRSGAGAATEVGGGKTEGASAGPGSAASAGGSGDSSSQHQAPQTLPLSCADITACCGGTTLALAGAFACATAVEVDEERSRDLEHNMRAAGLQVERVQECQLGAPCQGASRAASSSSSSSSSGGGGGIGIRGGPGRGGVRVLCGDAVRLLERLGWHDCFVVDPPWGGPAYLEQQRGEEDDLEVAEVVVVVEEEEEAEEGAGQEAEGAAVGCGREGLQAAVAAGGSSKEGGGMDSDGTRCCAHAGELAQDGEAPQGTEGAGRHKRPARVRPPSCSDMPLGGEPLSRLCARLGPLCRVALLRVPRRGFDLTAFSEAVVSGCCSSSCAQPEQQQQQQQQQHEPLILASELGRSQLLLVVYGGALVASEPQPTANGRSRKRWQLSARGSGGGSGDVGQGAAAVVVVGGGGGGAVWRLPEPCSVFVRGKGWVRCERDVPIMQG